MPPKKKSVTRAEIEKLLKDVVIVPQDDQIDKRNKKRLQHVEKELLKLGLIPQDIKAIMSDLPSYTDWEVPPRITRQV